MNANVLAALLDSGLVLSLSSVVDVTSEGDLLPVTFVPASEEWMTLDMPRHLVMDVCDGRCMCCCCTGECAMYGYDEEDEAEYASQC